MKKGTLFAASTLAAAALMLPAPAFAGGQWDDGQWHGNQWNDGGKKLGHGNQKIEKELEQFKIDDDHVKIYWSLPDAWDGVTEDDEEFDRLLAGWDEGQDGESIWPQSYDPEKKECGGVWQWDIYQISGYDQNVKHDLIAAIKSGELNSGQVQEVQWGEHAPNGQGWGFIEQPECGDEEVPEEEDKTPDPEPTPDEEEEEDVPLTPIEPAEPVEEEEAPEEEVVDEDEAEEEEAEEEEETAVEVTSNEVKAPEKATEELPETGSETTSATLIGAMLIALGGGAYATSRMLRARGNTVKLRHQR